MSIENKKKKSITPIITTILLLFASLAIFFLVQDWFEYYTSSFVADIDEDSDVNLKPEIERIVDGNLYFNNNRDNLVIKSLKIGNVSCSLTQFNYDRGMHIIDVENCTKDINEMTPEIVIITDKEIFSKVSVLLNNNTNPPSLSPPLNCSALSGGDWAEVPGNPLYGTNNFCVMRYEAKWDGTGTINNSAEGYCGNFNQYNVSTGCSVDGSIGIVSQRDSPPLTYVNQFAAIQLCNNLGEGYHLITNEEWMTIARNIESVSSNWADGVIGSTIATNGGLKRGNVGTVDSASYNGDWSESGSFRDTKALLSLSNGESVWDFSGNVMEWTTYNIDCTAGHNPCANMPYDSSPTSEYIELPMINTTGSLNYDLLRPINDTYNSNHGVGKFLSDYDLPTPNDSIWNLLHPLIRGGDANDINNAGVFAGYTAHSPSASTLSVGFRCTYSP